MGALNQYITKLLLGNLILSICIFCFEYLINKSFMILYSSFLPIYLFILLIFNSYLIYWFVINFKYLNLPYSLNIFRNVKQLEGNEKKFQSSHDVFKKSKHFENGFSLFYKNWISISIDDYNKKKKEILQYLDFKGEIDVKPYGRKGVELIFFNLPELIEVSVFEYEEGYINYGQGINGRFMLPISKQCHTVCVGESGSGKSNFMHHILQSILKNKNRIEKLEMIDLKGTELFRYKDLNYVNFIDNVESVKTTLLNLKNVMNDRFKKMKENNSQLYDGKFYFVFIDEIGTIGTFPNKKIKDEIFSLMVELFQKGRAAKILFFIFAQKIDSVNIPSGVLANIPTRILMKTDSDFNINNSIGTKESLEKITLKDPDSFPKGRAILKDGYSSEKVLLQIPYIKFIDN